MTIIGVGDFRIDEEAKNAINEVLDSGRITEGAKTAEFEETFAEYIGTKYCIALNSGTSAIIAGLNAVMHHKDFQVKKGSKVITSPVTYIATSNAISLSGLKPAYVDVSRNKFSITPESIKEHLEHADDPSEYSLILPVHIMGFPCDMDKINKIAKEYGLLTFEDSAQAHGTLYHGKKTGSLSLLSDFSFYVAHNIQAGELGAITTDDHEIYRLVKKIKANGRLCDCPICTRSKGFCPRMKETNDPDPRFMHDMIGYNFKTMEFQTALALMQLRKADEILKKRQDNVKYLNEQMIQFEDILQLPDFSEDVSYLAYPLVLKENAEIKRERLCKELEKKGIETRPLFGCIPTQQPAYAHLKEKYKDKLTNAEYLGNNAFYVGCHQYLEQEDLDKIISAFREVVKS